MADKESIDERAAHKYFSKQCFNAAWDLIEKENRSKKDNCEMLHLTHASVYHWSQRADCTDQNLSVGYWQLSRVYVLMGDGNSAIRYGEMCLEHSRMHGVAPIFLGYAYEALARAYAMTDDYEKRMLYINNAMELAQSLSDEDRGQLLGDLETIR